MQSIEVVTNSVLSHMWGIAPEKASANERMAAQRAAQTLQSATTGAWPTTILSYIFRKPVETIIVNLAGVKREVEMQVEEFHPCDPAAYQHEAGWTCYLGQREFFISQDGSVYAQPANECVGIAPALRAAADEMERQISEAMGHDA